MSSSENSKYCALRTLKVSGGAFRGTHSSDADFPGCQCLPSFPRRAVPTPWQQQGDDSSPFRASCSVPLVGPWGQQQKPDPGGKE